MIVTLTRNEDPLLIIIDLECHGTHRSRVPWHGNRVLSWSWARTERSARFEVQNCPKSHSLTISLNLTGFLKTEPWGVRPCSCLTPTEVSLPLSISLSISLLCDLKIGQSHWTLVWVGCWRNAVDARLRFISRLLCQAMYWRYFVTPDKWHVRWA